MTPTIERTLNHWNLGDLDTRVDAIVLRHAAQVCGVHEAASDASHDWFIVDESATIIDASSTRPQARELIGKPLSALARSGSMEALDSVWPAVMHGGARVVWPWAEDAAAISARSIEVHPIVDRTAGVLSVLGALVVVVDNT